MILIGRGTWVSSRAKRGLKHTNNSIHPLQRHHKLPLLEESVCFQQLPLYFDYCCNPMLRITRFWGMKSTTEPRFTFGSKRVLVVIDGTFRKCPISVEVWRYFVVAMGSIVIVAMASQARFYKLYLGYRFE